MRSPNLQINRKKHINLSIRKVPESPIFLLPSFFLIPKHDVNLEIEGFAFGFAFFRWCVQVNIRQNAWRRKTAAVDLVRANSLSAKIKEQFGAGPDPMGLVKAFERNRWLRELTSRGVEETHYGLRIIRDAAKEESLRREDSSSMDLSSSMATEIQIEGLE